MSSADDSAVEKVKTPSNQWTVKFLYKEFSKESDRAAVILVASLIDETLCSLLKNYLVPTPNSTDSLFDNANAALGNFSSKIDISFRLGLVSSKLCRDMHLIRKIRNSFAHDIYNCNFENGSVKSKVDELYKSVNKLKAHEADDSREKFLYISAGIIWSLNSLIKGVEPLNSQELEPDIYE